MLVEQEWENGLFIANSVFALIFTVEAGIKMLALYPRQYFSDRWNVFDFIVVVLSLVSVFVTWFASHANIPGLNLLRVFRVRLPGTRTRSKP